MTTPPPTTIRERLEDLASFVAETNHHDSGQIILHRENLAGTLWLALKEIDDLEDALSLERQRSEIRR